MATNIELLRNVDLFTQLPDMQLAQLAKHSRELSFPKHAVLMCEGDIGESMYVIKSGSVKVFVSNEHSDELILYQLGAGAVIGDIALLDNEPRSASVIALEKTTVIMISKRAFLTCLHSAPEMAIHIIHSLTLRLREATEGSRSLAMDTVYRRLTDKLKELSQDDDSDLKSLPKKYSHLELGKMVGASREMVGKVMSELLKGDYIEITDGKIRILRKLPRNW